MTDRKQMASGETSHTARERCTSNDSETTVADAALAKKAGELAFEYERTYRGCGQCALAAILDSLGSVDPVVADAAFAAATGVAGGLGLHGDATCGAFTGATMAFGLLYPRRRENFGGDRENKFRTYALTQQLHERFIETYGSITCHDIHRRLMGRSFNLRDADDRIAFEAAGAHADKCTGVVRHAVEWAVEIVKRTQAEEREP